jgi:hypothetical protein
MAMMAKPTIEPTAIPAIAPDDRVEPEDLALVVGGGLVASGGFMVFELET